MNAQNARVIFSARFSDRRSFRKYRFACALSTSLFVQFCLAAVLSLRLLENSISVVHRVRPDVLFRLISGHRVHCGCFRCRSNRRAGNSFVYAINVFYFFLTSEKNPIWSSVFTHFKCFHCWIELVQWNKRVQLSEWNTVKIFYARTFAYEYKLHDIF